MVIDLCWTVVSVVTAGLCLWNLLPWWALAWAGVASYALTNYFENKLKGSKFDY